MVLLTGRLDIAIQHLSEEWRFARNDKSRRKWSVTLFEPVLCRLLSIEEGWMVKMEGVPLCRGYLTVSDEVFMGALWAFLLTNTWCMNRSWCRTRHRQKYVMYLAVATPVISLGYTSHEYRIDLIKRSNLINHICTAIYFKLLRRGKNAVEVLWACYSACRGVITVR